MRQYISWIDKSELDALLGQLGDSSSRRSPTDPAPPPDAASLYRPPAPAAVSGVVRPKPESLPPVSSGPSAMDFSPPAAGLDEQVTALLDWAESELSSLGTFVTDEHGLILAERHAPEELIAASAELERAVQEVRQFFEGSLGHFTVSAGRTQLLTCVVAETDWGRFVVGLVTYQRPPEAALDKVEAAIRRTFGDGRGTGTIMQVERQSLQEER